MTFIRKISTSLSADAELLSHYKQTGETDTLAELFDRYIELVYAVCRKYLKDSEPAKDAVMDIFGQLPAKLQKHDVTNFRSWLFTVTKNHCLMQLRSVSGRRMVSPDEGLMQLQEEPHQYVVEEKEWQLEKMSECMNTLSPDQKRIIDLFYLQQKCYKDIAAMTGYAWDRVRSLVQNGRRNLKICMEQKKVAEENGIMKKIYHTKKIITKKDE